MPFDQFLERLRSFAGRLLSAMCQDEVALSTYVNEQGTVFLRAKLSKPDFEALRYSDLQNALCAVLARVGALRLDPSGKPFRVDFQLYDPSFESPFAPYPKPGDF